MAFITLRKRGENNFASSSRSQKLPLDLMQIIFQSYKVPVINKAPGARPGPTAHLPLQLMLSISPKQSWTRIDFSQFQPSLIFHFLTAHILLGSNWGCQCLVPARGAARHPNELIWRGRAGAGQALGHRRGEESPSHPWLREQKHSSAS